MSFAITQAMKELSLIDMIDLPLKRRVGSDGTYAPAAFSPVPSAPSTDLPQFRALERIRARGFDKAPKIPVEPLLPDEQYRFHFNAGLCIGCECCVVACNEQNNNPASVNWRRVGEIEGGTWPTTNRLYLSMGCNHCIDPSCLSGCPTDAYFKDSGTGIVRHHADSCIGCQYCIWNCPYGVPQFNADRGIVTKCDMCHARLSEGQEPACVQACPEEAIRIEKVNISAWKANHAEADAPGMPDSNQTISTTRITMPEQIPFDTERVNEHRIEPEDPHTPLIFLLTLTQLSVGGFAALWLCDILSILFPSLGRFEHRMGAIAAGMLFVAMLALNASIFHLGRPIHAWKALRMWKRSWLSREVLLFSLFSGFASLYSGLWLDRMYLGLFPFTAPARIALGSLVVLSGLAGVFSSAYIYMVPARPAWNTPRTLLRFFMTAFILGPLFAASLLLGSEYFLSSRLHHPVYSISLWTIVVIASLTQLVSLFTSVMDLIRDDVAELKGTAMLLTRRFRSLFLSRIAMLGAGGILLPALLAYSLPQSTQSDVARLFLISATSFALALASEFIGRYLFFVTVVPKNIAGAFFKPARSHSS
ncbi:MAG: DmsC/YnfH family molybdoenzyme membrane anchor subunit [Candidatus Hydrogenedentota bacterium]